MSLLPVLLSGAGGGGGGSGSVIGIILNPAVAASTANFFATYSNGSSGVGATLTNGASNLTAARVATTGALTVTQAGAGVGATLTNNGAQAAISIDSVALSLNDRVLVKNQASASQNGVYKVTTVGTGSTNWVLTRVTDFDQAAEMLAGTQINVTAGTTNIGTYWILAATVTTPDTTACTFNASAAFTLDGISPTVGQRVLIQNQTTAAQNGVYTVTTVGSGTVDWVLTRTTDFNQAAQMTAGTLIEVIGGTVNAGTVWELTTTVATVGSSSVTFISINISTKVDQNGSPIYAADTGAADAAVITLSPAPSAYTTGMVVRVKIKAANATTTPTINVNGLGAKTIVKDVNTALAANDLLANQFVELVYDGTNFVIWTQLGNASGTGTVTSVATAGLATGGTITSTGTITVTAAVQSDMETGTSTSVAVVPGVQQFHPGHPKAWVKSSATGTIAASYNVTSVTKDTAGRVHTTLTTSFSSANYHIQVSTEWDEGAGCVVDSTVGTPIAAGVFYTLNVTIANAATDPTAYFFSCHGDQ